MTIQWHGKNLTELSKEELAEASAYHQAVLDEIKDQAPLAVWGFFSDAVRDITMAMFAPKATEGYMSQLDIANSKTLIGGV